jgi:hypothetical protein
MIDRRTLFGAAALLGLTGTARAQTPAPEDAAAKRLREDWAGPRHGDADPDDQRMDPRPCPAIGRPVRRLYARLGGVRRRDEARFCL